MANDAQPRSPITTARRRRRPIRLRVKLLMFVFSVACAAVLGEVVVRLVKPGFPGFRIPQIEHRTVPGLGFEMVPNQIGYSNASRVTINSAGFRGAEIRTGRDAGSPRVLALGDSMTYGVAVEDHETYTYQLEQLMAQKMPASRPEVINTGVQRYFTFQEIDLLKANVEKLRPEIVTLMVYINDLGVRPSAEYVREFESEREQAATAFRRRMPTAYLLVKNSALVELGKIVHGVWKESRRTAPHMVENALEGRSSERDEPKWQGVEQELVSFSELAKLHQFRPLVLFIPVRKQLYVDLPSSLYPRRLADHATRLNLPVIDATDMFRESLRAGADPFLPWDDHMSVTGHRLIAEAVLRDLGRDGASASWFTDAAAGR